MTYKIQFLLICTLLISCNDNYKGRKEFENYLESQDYQQLKTSNKETIIDSLYSYVINTNLESISSGELFKLSEELYYLNSNIKSREIAKICLKKSISKNDSLSIGRTYINIGDTYKDNKKDSAYYFYSLSEKIYLLSGKNEEFAESQFSKAYILFYEGNYIDCEAKLVKALKYSENSKNYVFRYSYLNLMGNCQEKLKNYDLALSYHNKALLVLKKIKENDENLIYRVSSIINICNLHDIEGDYDFTIKTLSQLANEEKLKIKSPFLYSLVINNIAYAKMKKGDLLGVEDSFIKALKNSEELGNNNEILYRKINLGEYYLIIGNLKKSKFYLQETLRMSKNIRNYNEYLKSLIFLSRADKTNKDYYDSEYLKVKDSLINVQLANREKFARIEYETSKLEEENKKLNQQNLLILFAILFTVMLFIAIFLISNLQNQKRKIKLLNEKRKADEELYELVELHQKEIVNTKINEQKRISKELHDGIMNKLYGIRLNLGFFNEVAEENAITERRKYIDEIINVENEIRKVSHDLNENEEYKNTDLGELFYSLVSSQNNLKKTNFNLALDNTINWQQFPVIQKVHIYRIIQEAIHNVNKHAEAKNCIISFEKKHTIITLSIIDNGKGFVIDGEVGIGLKNIKERVSELKGKMSIYSDNKSGTKLIIVFNEMLKK